MWLLGRLQIHSHDKNLTMAQMKMAIYNWLFIIQDLILKLS